MMPIMDLQFYRPNRKDLLPSRKENVFIKNTTGRVFKADMNNKC